MVSSAECEFVAHLLNLMQILGPSMVMVCI